MCKLLPEIPVCFLKDLLDTVKNTFRSTGEAKETPEKEHILLKIYSV